MNIPPRQIPDVVVLRNILALVQHVHIVAGQAHSVLRQQVRGRGELQVVAPAPSGDNKGHTHHCKVNYREITVRTGVKHVTTVAEEQ